jgi:hypothetical protein
MNCTTAAAIYSVKPTPKKTSNIVNNRPALLTRCTSLYPTVEIVIIVIYSASKTPQFSITIYPVVPKMTMHSAIMIPVIRCFVFSILQLYQHFRLLIDKTGNVSAYWSNFFYSKHMGVSAEIRVGFF